jgi:hypothetical protein
MGCGSSKTVKQNQPRPKSKTHKYKNSLKNQNSFTQNSQIQIKSLKPKKRKTVDRASSPIRFLSPRPRKTFKNQAVQVGKNFQNSFKENSLKEKNENGLSNKKSEDEEDEDDNSSSIVNVPLMFEKSPKSKKPKNKEEETKEKKLEKIEKPYKNISFGAKGVDESSYLEYKNLSFGDRKKLEKSQQKRVTTILKKEELADDLEIKEIDGEEVIDLNLPIPSNSSESVKEKPVDKKKKNDDITSQKDDKSMLSSRVDRYFRVKNVRESLKNSNSDVSWFTMRRYDNGLSSNIDTKKVSSNTPQKNGKTGTRSFKPSRSVTKSAKTDKSALIYKSSNRNQLLKEALSTNTKKVKGKNQYIEYSKSDLSELRSMMNIKKKSAQQLGSIDVRENKRQKPTKM